MTLEQTAKEPGAFLAAVHPQPRYRPKPSSPIILNRPRPLKASGFVCRLILSTSRGSRTISPIPIKLCRCQLPSLQPPPCECAHTCQPWSARLPCPSSFQRPTRSPCRSARRGSRAQWADRRTCISAGGPCNRRRIPARGRVRRTCGQWARWQSL